IGPRTPETPETNFAVEERSYNFSLYHDIFPGSQIGVYARVANSAGYRGENEDDTPIDTLFSGQPTISPVTRWLPGLNNNAKIFSYGVFAEFDGRKNEKGLTRGYYGYYRFASHEGLKNDLFSDFGWNEIESDTRGYLPLGSDSTSFAFRFYTETKDPKRGSQIPFYEQAYFGGRSHGRGFANFRFRGNNSILLSVEPRQTVWKQKETRGVDVFAFGDFGQVWGDNRSRTNPQVLANDVSDSRNWRTGFGGGLQYRWNKSVAVRIEYGRSNETGRIYFSMSRGF
ncbi:MAG: BamA/TamA family outer membrane protein, partial [Acidobacteriota bacterium]